MGADAERTRSVDAVVFDTLPDAILVLRDDRVAWATAATYRLLHAAPGSLAGRALADLLAPGDGERLAVVESQRAQGWLVPEPSRLKMRRDDGALVLVDLRVRRAELEEDPAVVIVARDATEADRGARLMGQLAELSAQEPLLVDENALLDASEPIFRALGWRGGLIEVDAEGATTLRTVAAVPGDPITEYTQSLVGRRVPLARFPIVAEVFRAQRAIFLDNLPGMQHGPTRLATQLHQSMERARVSRSLWCPVRVGGRPTHVLSIGGNDLTEHDVVAIQLFAAQIGAAIQTRRLRTELVRRERLSAIGEMAAVLAHEVRNPIGVIYNAIGAMRRLCAGLPEAISLVGIVGEEADRLRALVRDLLEYARPPTPQLLSVDLERLVAHAIEAAELEAAREAPKPRIELEVAESLPWVETDPALLRRVVVNLVTNALQHVSAGGRVRVSAEPIDERWLRLRVQNDGEPILKEQATRIFEPFFTTRATGTGLGLAIVRRLVGDLGGTIALDDVDGGVSFTLTLPARCADSSTPPPKDGGGLGPGETTASIAT